MNKKTQVLLLHGLGVTYQECFYPWLQKTLNSTNQFNVHLPELPDYRRPKLAKWFQTIKTVFKQIPKEDPLIIVGHSMGALFALRILENKICQTKQYWQDRLVGVYLVSSPSHYDGCGKNFYSPEIDWQFINQNLKSTPTYVVWDHLDDIIFREHTDEIVSNLKNCECIFTTGLGHYMEKEFTMLSELIIQNHSNKKGGENEDERENRNVDEKGNKNKTIQK
ncbi:hypothetical protein M0813_17950 [Anaeramoeba flamelloides]|uniref:Uncharacterized protein n=1 Tax=Anaeramoeba flamelloides TaxID=1746091 RepID=A0ABQ8YUH9_9EUKA|nr:hypothetical protein M0813_17950 [Anaeramoeba flamelloides]